ncbi:MAG: hypothetical protein EOP66_04490 [Sphingomonas sp.]|nr:MAG: hypothetical protein EOP66_04490 [Sphingomonas sp.]
MGVTLVFGREGGGHVGFYVGEDDHAYHAIGRNQSNSVCITRIAKSRLIAARWPRVVPVKGGSNEGGRGRAAVAQRGLRPEHRHEEPVR